MTTIQEKKLEKLQNLLKMMDESLTREEFVKSFEAVVNLVLKIQKQNEEAVHAMEHLHKEIMNKIKGDNSEMMGSSTQELKSKIMDMCGAEIKRMYKEHEEMMRTMDKKMAEMHSGKDADEEQIVQDVLAQIKLPEQKEVILDTPEQLRNKLEKLKGEDRLDKESIRGFEEEIKGLKVAIAAIPRGTRSMGRAKIYIQRWVYLTDQVDGVATTFTLPRDVVAVHGLISTQFPQAWNLTDFSLAGNILTTNFTMQSGATLIAVCEVLFSP